MHPWLDGQLMQCTVAGARAGAEEAGGATGILAEIRVTPRGIRKSLGRLYVQESSIGGTATLRKWRV